MVLYRPSSLQLRGIEELEDGDSTSVFALARTLLTVGGCWPPDAGLRWAHVLPVCLLH